MRRVQPNMPELLDESQGGVAQTRPIQTMMADLRELIQAYRFLGVPEFAILSTDFQNAFSAINIQYLMSVLKQMNFPQVFIQLLRNLFKIRMLKIQVNGRTLTEFRMERGLNQGASLSPFLFSLALTPLVTLIKYQLAGVTYRQTKLRALVYMDDAIWITRTAGEMQKVLAALHIFQRASNIAINAQKTKILVMDPTAAQLYSKLGTVVPHINYLGLSWAPTIKQTIEINSQRLAQRLISELKKYMACFQTLLARTQFVNIYIISQATHILQMLPLTNKAQALITQWIGHFIWHSHVFRVKRASCYLALQEGGLNLRSISIHGQALRVHRVIQILSQHQFSFASQVIESVWQYVDRSLPLNIQVWKNMLPYLTDSLCDISYLTHTPIPMEQWSVKNFTPTSKSNK